MSLAYPNTKGQPEGTRCDSCSEVTPVICYGLKTGADGWERIHHSDFCPECVARYKAIVGLDAYIDARIRQLLEERGL